ncbi:uncharacterized protein LOC123685901 isoform X2 [Harmonia axyridis]|uniref:uncharacterized protein LOC123685901 isoform X2 n=1 Tax=Harmonia axyridis TaxID=115357 RepID=UPI001E277EDF|nr:uncharacterized protein LOC123685901 isoform X2 [Harmonia axyridis]
MDKCHRDPHLIQNIIFFDEAPTGCVSIIHNTPKRRNPGGFDESLWFQQDCAPSHYAADVRRYLDGIFPNMWIGRREPTEWPARSPDFNPLDYFIWAHLKNVVYKTKPANIEEFKERIQTEINNITQETIHKFQDYFLKWSV